MSCRKCGSPFHEEWACWKSERGKPKAVEPDDTSKPPLLSEPIVGKRRGRPQTITDMKTYKRDKERGRRAKMKATSNPS